MLPGTLKNGSRTCTHWVWFMFLFFGSNTSVDLKAADEIAIADDVRIEALEAAFDEWVRGVSFRCDYEMVKRKARSVTIESGEIQAAFIGSPTKITGLLAKEGADIRTRIDYGRPPRETGPSQVSDVSIDEVIRGGVGASYRFHLRADDYVAFFPRDILDGSSDIPAFHALDGRLPLSPLGGAKDPNPLRTLDIQMSGPPAKRVLSSVDKDRLKISLSKSYESGQFRIDVVFWTEPELPVVSELKLSFVEPEGETIQHAFLSDFVECSGGHVAGKVKVVSSGARAKGSWVVTEWTGKNLAPPSDTDFLLHVPKQADMDCLKESSLKKLPVIGDERVIDLTVLTRQDLSCYGELASDSPSPWRRTLLFALLAVVAVTAFVYLYRRFVYDRRKAQPT